MRSTEASLSGDESPATLSLGAIASFLMQQQ
jgi:hypothetical protein